MKILNNVYVRYAITLVIGVAIGAIFYPTKHIEREIESKYQEKVQRLEYDRRYIEEKYSQELNREIKSNIEYRKEVTQKMSSLKTENTQLKQQVKKRKLKIVKPDGTIVEETFEESQTEVISKVVTEVRQEFDRKVSSIESKWKKVHEKRVKDIKEKHEKELKKKEEVISSYKKKETIKINPRDFSLAIGKMDDDQMYGNISYDVFGPVFINLQLESDPQFQDKSVGAGIGIKF